MKSPTFNVPPNTRTVATYPLPLSKEASITVPVANFLGLAFNSSISDSRRIFSNNSSIPIPFLAEISCS